MSRDNSASTPWWEQDASVLLGNGQNRIDEKTIHHTPVPLASSTVLKNPDGKDKPAPPRHSLFMSEEKEMTPGRSGEDIVRFSLSDLDLLKDASGKEAQKERDLLTCTDPFMNVQQVDNLLPYPGENSSNTRTSSMGIIPLDSFEDLSSSLLDRDLSKKSPNFAKCESNGKKTNSGAGAVGGGKLSGIGGPKGIFLSLNDEDDDEEEMNATIPVVQINEDDLKKLDDEFGDFDFNSTMTDDQPDQSRMSMESRDCNQDQWRVGRESVDPGGEVVERYGSRFGREAMEPAGEDVGRRSRPGIDGNTMRPTDIVLDRRGARNFTERVGRDSLDPDRDSLDGFGKPGAYVGLGRDSDSRVDAGYAGDLSSRFGLDSTDPAGDILERHGIPDLSSRFDQLAGQDRFMPIGNAGNTARTKGPSLDPLDPLYLRASPKPSLHEDGDGQEDTTMSMSRPRFSQSLFPDDTAAARTNVNGSEIDTDDEIEAARRDIDGLMERQDTPGASEDDRVQRPGLEGARSSDEGNAGTRGDFSVRQNAEGGVMVSSVPGDGGGGGDGTSASDEDTPMPTGSRQAALHSRQIGGGVFRSAFVEDDPDAQPRIQPVGEDDVLMERSMRQVRFTNTYDEESRDIPGSSERGPWMENQTVSSQSSDSGEAADTRMSNLASRFLRPNSISSLAATDTRTSWAIGDQSSFILDNIIPGAGDGDIPLDNEATLTPYNQIPVVSGVTSMYSDQPSISSYGNNTRDSSQMRPGSDIFGSQPSPELFTQANQDVPTDPNTTDMIFTGQSSLGSFGLAQKNQSGKEDRSFQPSLGGLDFSEFLYKPSPSGQSDRGVSQPSESREWEGLDTTAEPSMSRENPIYLSEDGECVTDLAYRTTFTHSQNIELSEEEDFMPTAESHALMDKNERQFECLTQDESATARKTSSVCSSGSGSWSLRSEGTVLRPSWMSAEEAEDKFLRISIGTFMGGRTEALGSLDGEEGAVRPDFGRVIVTPPSARKPFALIQATPNLSDIQETTDYEDRSIGHSSENTPNTSPSRVVKQFNVDSPDPVDQTCTPEVMNQKSSYETGTGTPIVTGSDSVFYTPVPGEKSVKSDLSGSTGHSAQSSDRSDKEDSTFMDKSGAVNISAINKLLSNASINTKPEDLAAMILKMSYAPKAKMQAGELSSGVGLGSGLGNIAENPDIGAERKLSKPLPGERTSSRSSTSIGMSDKPPIPSKIPSLDKTVRPSRQSFPRYGENDVPVPKVNPDESAKRLSRLSNISAPERNRGKDLSENSTGKNSPSNSRPSVGKDQSARVKNSKESPLNSAPAQEESKLKYPETGRSGPEMGKNSPKKISSSARGLPKPKMDAKKAGSSKGSPVKMLKLKPPPARRPQDELSSDEEASGPQPRPPRKASSRKKGQKEEGKNSTSKYSSGSNGGASPAFDGRSKVEGKNGREDVQQELAVDNQTHADELDQQKASQIPRRIRSESPPKAVEKPKSSNQTRIPRPVSSSRSRSRSADGDEKRSPGGALGEGADRKGERMSRRDMGVIRMEPVQEASSPQWEQRKPRQEDGDFDAGGTIPSSPPIGWNTPRPSSVFSRPSSTQSNEESPPMKQALNYTKSSSVGVVSPSIQSPNKYNNYTGSSELTSGFHSQATDFMQTYNQTHVTRSSDPSAAGATMNKTPSMHRLTPHYDVTPNDDVTYRPRLSSTPMYGAPQTSPPVQDMPSNIVTTPGNRLLYGSDSLETTQHSPNPASPIVSSPTTIRYETSIQGGEDLVQGRSVSHQNVYHPPSSRTNLQTDMQYFIPHSSNAQPSYAGTLTQTRPFSQSDLYGTATTYVHGPSNISTFTSQAAARPDNITTNSAASNGQLQTLPPRQGLDVRNGRDQERFLRTAPQFGISDLASRRREVATTGNATMPRDFREVTRVPNITAPGEVKFQDVCCVGMTTRCCIPLQNPNDRWLHCTLRIVTVNIDGRDRAPNLSPFVMKQQVILGPNSVEEIEVIFAPRIEGVYVAHLHLVISPVANDSPLQPVKVPAMVTLQGIAEMPNIQVVCNGESILDFGQLPWGSQTSVPLTLINRGRATVPVRLVITGNTTSWRHFSFEHFSDSTSDIMPSLSKSVISGTVQGRGENSIHGEPVQIMLYLQTPDKQYDRGHLHLPPEKLSARIDVELDITSTSTMHAPLCIVNLRALVGSARLRAPAAMQSITLKTTLGKSTTHILPLQNAGNIQLKVSFNVTDHEDVFAILPSQLEIEESSQADVVIKFQPKAASQKPYRTVLLMNIEPSGPAYEIDITGEVANREPTRHSSDIVLLSNKHFLSWGGVGLGETVPQKLVLRNPTNNTRHFRMQIKGSSQDFKLRSLTYTQEKLLPEKEIVMKPMEDYPIHVIFEPSAVATCSAKLNIKTDSSNFKYSIPLMGYGGKCAIVLDGANDGQKGHYWLNTGEITDSHRVMVRVTVRNRGARAGFVKALPFHDMNCKKKMSHSIITVQPSEFVLGEKDSKVVVIVINPSNREAVLCQDQRSIIGAVAFYFGDELSRQKYRRAKLNKQKVNPSVSIGESLQDVNFDVSYQGDELIPSCLDVSDSPTDMELFYANMSKVVTALVGDTPKPKSSSHYNTKTLGAIENGLARPINDNMMCTPPVKGTPSMRRGSKSQSPVHMKSLEKEDWTIQPEQIILGSPKYSSENNVKRLQINNFTDKPQQFEFTWPAHCVSVTPEQGSIPARSSALICISANPTLYNRGIILPWRGQVHISCAGTDKVVKVQIRDEPTKDVVSTTTNRHQPLVTVVDRNRPASCSVSVISKEIAFPETVTGETADQCLEMVNNDEHDVTWTITQFAPAYLKDPSARGELHRLSYPAFQFLKTSGTVLPGQTLKVPLIFMPQEVGSHSQFFDLQLKLKSPVAATASNTRIQCMGQSISHLSAGLVNGFPDHERSKPRKESIKEKKPKSPRHRGIVVSCDEVVFPITRTGEAETLRVVIKNHSPITEIVQFDGPSPPFKVNFRNLEIKSRHFLRMPVEFRPDRPGRFSSELMLKGSKDHITLQLRGQAE
ncbi:uncharacterized protein LOC135495313 [Lineus longissimus]|uniref:uncharacterized protein LOC135495313 n=1 Tax=Lineus longissimus TaxID=88925 RepID=UPI002B4DD388